MLVSPSDQLGRNHLLCRERLKLRGDGIPIDLQYTILDRNIMTQTCPDLIQ